MRPNRTLAALIGLLLVHGTHRASADADVQFPPTLTSATRLRPALEHMRRSSPTFWRQCRRLATAPHVHVSLEVEETARRPSHRARSTMTSRDGLLVSAVIRVSLFDDPVELIAHELEHVIEQLDGVDLEAHSRTGMAWRRDDGAFETWRATEIGRRVAREANMPSPPRTPPTPPGAPWKPLHVVAQQQPWPNAHDPASARVSADGRFVVLASNARLSPDDDNTLSDIYVIEVGTGLVTLETPAATGGTADGSSLHPGISADGRYIVFESTAGNLVAGGLASGIPRVFLRDRETAVTRLLSTTPAGEPADGISRTPAISADGRVAVFTSTSTNLSGDVNAGGGVGVYRIDLVSGARSRMDLTPAGRPPAGQGASPVLSADGRFVAFTSSADLTTSHGGTRGGQPRDGNGVFDVYVRDVLEARTTRVSVGSSGADSDGASYHPAISLDGRFVVFVSEASNLTSPRRRWPAQVLMRDMETGAIELVSHSPSGSAGNAPSARPVVSADASVIAYQSLASNLRCDRRCQVSDLDTNLLWDVYVYERRTRRTTRVSHGASDECMDGSRGPSLDASGRTLAFASTHPHSADEPAHDEDLFVVGTDQE